jgi:hypothetical protein
MSKQHVKTACQKTLSVSPIPQESTATSRWKITLENLDSAERSVGTVTSFRCFQFRQLSVLGQPRDRCFRNPLVPTFKDGDSNRTGLASQVDLATV